MRTTVTLEDNVAAKLRDEMMRTGSSMNDAVNTLLRRGFESRGEEELAASFTVDARSMGVRAGFDVDDIGGLLDLLDGPASTTLAMARQSVPDIHPDGE